MAHLDSGDVDVIEQILLTKIKDNLSIGIRSERAKWDYDYIEIKIDLLLDTKVIATATEPIYSPC